MTSSIPGSVAPESTPRALARHRLARRPVAPVIALALGLGASGPAGADTYRIDPARSTLVLRTYKDGLGARLAHDHVVEATAFAGTVEHTPARPEATSLTVEVQTASLRIDAPAARRALGLAELSAGNVSEIDRAMRSADQLDVARFPTIRFVSTRVTRDADSRLRITGQLTIRGVTREVVFPAEVAPEGSALRGRATLTLTQSRFGYQPYSTLLGAIRNKDEVTLHVDLVATP